jgi:uncharacterized membrane protein YvbJ
MTMKKLTKISTLALAVILTSSVAFANDDPNSKLVEKAKTAVSNADESDWETLAQSSEICFIKGENIEEALVWIDRSIAIKETSYNLEDKADYLSKVSRDKEAMKLYYQALLITKEINPQANTENLQQKIWNLR